MWPEKQQYPDSDKIRDVLDRNPEAAATRGKWADVDFLKQVSELNPQMKDTQFADYHGHGWNFRAVFKRDRKGNLLDATRTSSATTIRRSSRRACTCRRFTSTSACSASTVTSRRTITATATSTAKSPLPSRSPARIATALRRPCRISTRPGPLHSAAAWT